MWCNSSRCKKRYKVDIKTAQVNADSVADLVALFNEHKPKLVINVALPYQDLTIMDACSALWSKLPWHSQLRTQGWSKIRIPWQWLIRINSKSRIYSHPRMWFRPGVTSIFTAICSQASFRRNTFFDIVDCNAGDHGKAFATNFNPWNKYTWGNQKGKYYENGKWVETEPHQIHKPLNYPEIGAKESYVIYHEELESFVKNFPTIKRARFWMTFDRNTSPPVCNSEYRYGPYRRSGIQRTEIVPIQFLKAVLPNPVIWEKTTKGNVNRMPYQRI